MLIDCSGPPDEPRNEETGMARKRDALLSQLERRMALRTLVFCNTIQGCRQASVLCMDMDVIYSAGTEDFDKSSTYCMLKTIDEFSAQHAWLSL